VEIWEARKEGLLVTEYLPFLGFLMENEKIGTVFLQKSVNIYKTT
jgi:hypothetical protein